MPPLGPQWCENIYSFRWIVTRVMHKDVGVMLGSDRSDGNVINYCFPNYCS
jgi:hypothetical protein